VFLCLLAYYVEWQMAQALKPMLHDDEELEEQRESRANPRGATPRSERAKGHGASTIAPRTIYRRAQLAYRCCSIGAP